MIKLSHIYNFMLKTLVWFSVGVITAFVIIIYGTFIKDFLKLNNFI